MNLRWCGAAAAADAAARLGLVNPRFRDEHGAWWTVDGGRWQAWRGGVWQAAEPPERVEGPATDLPAVDSPARAKSDADGARDVELVPTLEGAARRIGDDYRAGLLSSDAAEAALERLYTIDTDGGVWAVGVHSGRWHRFAGGSWQPAGGPPDASRLVAGDRLATDEAPEAVRAGVAAFLAQDDSLPEPVAEPWLPAAGGDDPNAWRATHRIPAPGLRAWETPDAAAAPFGSLAAGLHVQVTERSGAWARVRRPGGSECWVDGRLLVDL